MMLEHPQITRISCADCKKWIVNLKTGEFPLRGGKKQPRGDAITPCRECPKESPDNEKFCILTEANQRVLEMWYRYRACGWDGLPPACKGDPILVRQFSWIDMVTRAHEQRKQARMMANEMLPLINLSSK